MGAFSHTTHHSGYDQVHPKLHPSKCCENCLPSVTNLKPSHHHLHISPSTSMSDEHSSQFGNSSGPPQDEILSISRKSSSSNTSSKLENTRIGITLMGPIRHLSFGAKPKPVLRSKLPGVVIFQKVLPACKAKGKGQKCSNKPYEAILLQANKNIETLQDILEKTNTDLISCWENAKDIISQYDRTNKDLDKQLQSIRSS